MDLDIEPGGFKAISRGLSEAIPPGSDVASSCDPVRGRSREAGTPVGVLPVIAWQTGGIASLNPG